LPAYIAFARQVLPSRKSIRFQCKNIILNKYNN